MSYQAYCLREQRREQDILAAVLFHEEQAPIDVDAIGEAELALMEQLAAEEAELLHHSAHFED